MILIVADDLGIHDLAPGDALETPNIESIAVNGAKFLNSYSGHSTWSSIYIFVTSCCLIYGIFICRIYSAPSRAALFTGRFATRFGFEFTPAPKMFAKLLTKTRSLNIHQPFYFSKSAKHVPPIDKMVSFLKLLFSYLASMRCFVLQGCSDRRSNDPPNFA